MSERRLSTGARIAAYRRLNRLTQRGLAARANVSHSLLTKVEVGSKPASQSFLAACAKAMAIPVTHLTGQPFIEEQSEDRLSGPLNDLRASLENFDLTLDDSPARTLAEIRPDVRDMVLARRDAQYARILGRSPALIDELVQLSQTLAGHHAEQAHHLLVQLYRSAADVAMPSAWWTLCHCSSPAWISPHLDVAIPTRLRPIATCVRTRRSPQAATSLATGSSKPPLPTSTQASVRLIL